MIQNWKDSKMTLSTFSAISTFKKHGICRSELSFQLTSKFSISPIFSPVLSKYFIRYWSKDYFLRISSLVSLYTGTIPIEGKEYVVIYHRCTRGEILQMQDSEQLVLSFRAALPEYNLPAYVLVSKKSRTFPV